MSKPLTEEVAREYGYGVKPFQVWADNYFNSLEIEKRKNEIKPIKMRDGNNLLTDEMMEYAISYNENRGTLILNPNYIYILDNYMKFIAVKDAKMLHDKGTRIEGIYATIKPFSSKGHYTYSRLGFYSSYTVIGVLKLPSQIKFMNWKESPFDQK